MDWSQAVLRVTQPRCDAAGQLKDGQRLRCINPGGKGSILAHLEGADVPPGWEGMQCGTKNGFVIKEQGCAECPVKCLPSDVLPLQADVTSGNLEVRVVSARPAALAEAYHNLRRTGQGPRVHRSGRLRASSPTTAVDLSVLTPRQQEALEQAAQLGYFESGNVGVDALAKALGCSRSTAHEHLRRGLQRLIAEIFN